MSNAGHLHRRQLQAKVTHYSKPERAEPPEFTEPVEVVVGTPAWFSSGPVAEGSRSRLSCELK
jgi:hypothetical protein